MEEDHNRKLKSSVLCFGFEGRSAVNEENFLSDPFQFVFLKILIVFSLKISCFHNKQLICG